MSKHANYKGTTAPLNMMVTPEMKRKLSKMAWDRDTSISKMVRGWIEKGMEQ